MGVSQTKISKRSSNKAPFVTTNGHKASATGAREKRHTANLACPSAPMSALGQKRTFAVQNGMSALPRKRTFPNALVFPLRAMNFSAPPKALSRRDPIGEEGYN